MAIADGLNIGIDAFVTQIKVSHSEMVINTYHVSNLERIDYCKIEK